MKIKTFLGKAWCRLWETGAPTLQRVGEIVSNCSSSFGKRKRGGIVKSSASKLHPLGFSILTLSIHTGQFVLNKLWRLKNVQK